tara:strand:+ start:321 stop:713 length:393 start_codon:yes stop_codon:yes gene_type:complete
VRTQQRLAKGVALLKEITMHIEQLLQKHPHSGICRESSNKGTIAYSATIPSKAEKRWIKLWEVENFLPQFHSFIYSITYLDSEKQASSPMARSGGSIEFALLFFERLMIDCVDFEDLPDLREDPIYGDNS